MKFDVVVVGAGPVGLVLAAELRLRLAQPRLSVVVLERRTAVVDETIKAGGIGAAAVEMLARRGLAAQLQEVVEKVPLMRSNKQHFAGLYLLDLTLQADPARTAALVSQQSLERMLLAHATALGVEIRRGVEVSGLANNDDGVVLTLADQSTLAAAYVVGCDGGRSTVRKLAAFEFLGTDPTLTGYQAIATLVHADKLEPFGWRRTDRGMLFVQGAMPGGRLVVIEFDHPPADRTSPVTLDELQAALQRVSGTDVTIAEVKTATRWTDHTRQAATYRKGRVLLAGDAAHVHSPFGGQGIQLGIGDAVNLGWKLAAAADDDAAADGDALLDSYTSERHPVAAAVLENTRAQIALMRPGPHVAALRELFSHIAGFVEPNRYLYGVISGLDVRYANLADADSGATRHTLLGIAAANLEFTDGTVTFRLFDLLHEGHAVLIDLTGDRRHIRDAEPVQGARAGPVRLKCVHADRCTSRGDFVALLVRPDGFVAWVAEAGDDRDATRLLLALKRCAARI